MFQAQQGRHGIRCSEGSFLLARELSRATATPSLRPTPLAQCGLEIHGGIRQSTVKPAGLNSATEGRKLTVTAAGRREEGDVR